MYTDLQQQQPLHQLIFGWFPWPRKPTTRVVAITLEPVDVTGRMKASTVQQLVTSMRMQGIAGEDDHMLTSLETLVIAGEISFSDFIGRIQNLFPRAVDGLDVSMRMKIASLMM